MKSALKRPTRLCLSALFFIRTGLGTHFCTRRGCSVAAATPERDSVTAT